MSARRVNLGFHRLARRTSEADLNAIARGKTHLSRALERYLRWMGVKTRVYSLGDYRRKVLGGADSLPADYFQTNGAFLAPAHIAGDELLLIAFAAPRSTSTDELRQRIKNELEDQIWDFFTVQGGQVVIYDANNGDKISRKGCFDKFEPRGVHVIFLGEAELLSEVEVWLME